VNLCIAVPIYKENLEYHELISFNRINSVLKNVPKFFIYPEGLKLDAYKSSSGNITFLPLDPKYFKSIDYYNILLKSPIFYKQFMDFKYLLIYQLDSYIFEEQNINYFLKSNFDYIGAPWLKLDWFDNSEKLISKIKILRPFIKKIGNGGFSLRRVKTFYDFSQKFSHLGRIVTIQEDIFWTNVASRLIHNFKLPSVSESLKFSFDENPRKCFELNNNKLPFGCHGWHKNDYEFWKMYINE